MMALISCGVKALLSILMRLSVPISRLMEEMVRLALVTAWRLAAAPTMRSPSLVKATTDGVVRPPSALGMTTGSPFSIKATQELVVPRSMPMVLPMNQVPPDGSAPVISIHP